MASLRQLANDLAFYDFPEGKRYIIARRVGQEDPEFQRFSTQEQQIILDRIVHPPGTLARIGQRISAIPGKVREGVEAAGRAIARAGGGIEGLSIDLPVPSTPGQDVRAIAEGVTAPFEVIAAPVGETVRAGLTRLTRDMKTVPVIPHEFTGEAVDVPRESFIQTGQAAAEIGAGIAVPAFPLTRAALGAARYTGLLPKAVKAGRAAAEVAQEAPRVFEALGGESGIIGREFPGEPMLRAAQEAPTLPPRIEVPRLAPETTRKVLQAAGDFMEAHGIARDPSQRLLYHVTDILTRRPDLVRPFNRILESRGATSLDWAEALKLTGSDAGKTLNELSQLSKRIAEVPELADIGRGLEPAPPTGWQYALHWKDSAVNLWRKSLIAAWSTATRNFASQLARLGVDSVDQVLQGVIRSMTGATAAERRIGPSVRMAFENFAALVSRGKRAHVDAILDAFPQEADRLFTHWASDIVRQREPFGLRTAHRLVDYANFLNFGQEKFIRKTALYAKLNERLARRALDIRTVKLTDIPVEDVVSAVDHALDITFAISPGKGPGKAFLDLYSNPWMKDLLTVNVPFPRFLYNATKYMVDFSPAGLLRFTTDAGRNAETVSRALIGSVMYLGAWQLVNSGHAGEQWYELRAGDKRVDTRPYMPLAAPLAFARLYKAWLEQDVHFNILAENVVQNLFPFTRGTGGGIGQFTVEGLRDFFAGRETSKARTASRFFGEFLGGFAQPLTTFKELFADFGQWTALPDSVQEAAREEQIIRDVRERPVLGPTMRRIPGVSQALPEREGALRGGPFRQEGLFSRQLTGIPIQTRTAVEAEAARLGFTPIDIEPRTGDPTADRLILRYMGPAVERVLGLVIRGPRYRREDDAGRRVLFHRAVGRIRQAAYRSAKEDDPPRFARIQLKRAFSRFERDLLRERGVIPEELR